MGQLTDISPVTGGIGTRVKLQGKGFDKNDQIQVTLTSPNGVKYTIPTADISGSPTNSQRCVIDTVFLTNVCLLSHP